MRFRFLDEKLYIQGLSDLAVPASDFARLAPAAKNVFITENKINGLAFPDLPSSLVVFGLGYGLSRLAQSAAWLSAKKVFYWGDIDTHGFVMLDRLRAILPQAQSFLMDRETLMLHRTSWVVEGERYGGILDRLTLPEQSLFDDLWCDRLGSHVRLEQDLIGFGWLRRALSELNLEG